MSLKMHGWKEVRFGDLFTEKEIYKAKAYSKEDLLIAKYPDENTISYVTRTEANNSVECFVYDNNLEKTEKGNALVIGDTTATVSYQKYPFVAGEHIVVIRPKWLNEYNGLFFETILNKERFRYSYGRAFVKKLIKNTILYIPFKDDNNPDFEEMEKIIKKLKYKPILTKNISKTEMSLDINDWKYFKIGDIFIKVDVPKHSSIPDSSGDIPFISSTGLNNGVSNYVNEKSIDGNCITVSTNGGCFDTFYQPGRIALSTDVEVLYNDILNPKIALFICTVIKMEKYKWSYGRKPKNNKVFKTLIKLPVLKDKNGEIYIDSEKKYSKKGYVPDFDFMEKYIESLRFGDKI